MFWFNPGSLFKAIFKDVQAFWSKQFSEGKTGSNPVPRPSSFYFVAHLFFDAV